MVALPHFVVIGAQKSGTTSLCAALEQVAGICLSRPKEPLFFSRDEIELHPHFFAEQLAEWQQFDWRTHQSHLLERYRGYFSHAQTGDLCGEGSTSYLLSQRAPERIHAINPHAKIIAILRDPAARAYSAYWHYVKCGIATESFANHLRYESGLTLRGGDYAAAISRWLSIFPREQCHFIVYEEMLKHPADTLASLLAFLNIQPAIVPPLPSENRGRTPRLLWLQLLINLINRRCGAHHSAIASENATPWLQQALKPVERWNLTTAPYPPMPLALHQALDRHYATANATLTELTGLNVSPWWYQTMR